MSRCVCCNAVLSDFEATRKHAVTGEYIMICDRCLPGLGIPTTSRVDLVEKDDEVYDDNTYYDDTSDYSHSYSDYTDSWLSSDDR